MRENISSMRRELLLSLVFLRTCVVALSTASSSSINLEPPTRPYLRSLVRCLSLL